MAQEMDAASGRLAHLRTTPAGHGQAQDVVAGAQPTTRRPALALTAEGPRRADLIAWAGAHRTTLSTMRLLAPAGIGALLARARRADRRAAAVGHHRPGRDRRPRRGRRDRRDDRVQRPDRAAPRRQHDPVADPAGGLLGHPDRGQPGHRGPAAGHADIDGTRLSPARRGPPDARPTAEPVRGAVQAVDGPGHRRRRARPAGHPGRQPGPAGDQHPVRPGAPDARRSGRRAARRGVAGALRGRPHRRRGRRRRPRRRGWPRPTRTRWSTRRPGRCAGHPA